MASTARMARSWGLRRASIETWSAFRFELNHDLRARQFYQPGAADQAIAKIKLGVGLERAKGLPCGIARWGHERKVFKLLLTEPFGQ
jgi:hypothetical protein